MASFLTALDPDDEEHGAAWVSDEADNSIEYEVSGNVSYRAGDRSRHLPSVLKARVLPLWIALAEGDFAALEREPWHPGARPPLSPEQIQERERAFASAQLAFDRSFYEELGAERPNTACRAPGCQRGTISLSVFCRPHHFASVRGRVSPFEE